MRIERNLSQGGLATALASKRHLSWVSKIERGEIEPALSDISALAKVLNVHVEWLLNGEDADDSEFLARLRGMETQMDERGKRAVLATAEREVEEYQKTLQTDAEFSARVEQMLAVIPTLTREQAEQGVRAVLASQGSVPAVHEATEEALPRPVSRARA